MPFTLTMPKLSPTMEEGTIVKWNKNVGDFVASGDVLFEVATDKATVEYNALDEGFLRQVLVENGKEARVGACIAVFAATKEEDISSYKPQSMIEEKEPEISKEENVVAQVEKKPAQVSTGVLSQPAFTAEPPLEDYSFCFPEEVQDRIVATPYAKKKAKELGIDLSTIKGSGPRNRILSKDLALGQPSGCHVFGSFKAPQTAPGTYEIESLSPMRKVIATRLQQSKSFIPHFYVSQQIDAEPMITLRQQLKEGGVKITVNDILIRALAVTLKDHPVINSGFDSVAGGIIRFKTVDIAVAVSVPAGLITPIIRHADFKNLGQISQEVRMLAEKAKLGKLSREEYVGGSCTLSNLGMFGVSEFKGIINPPQAAILCVGGIEDRPVVKQGMVVPGKVMTLSLSLDHRVIDGSDAAKFIKALQKNLENPALLLVM